MQSSDPYRPPDSSLESQPEEVAFTLGSPQRVVLARGFQWYAEGFRVFTRNPGPWLLCMLILFVLIIGVSFVPMPNEHFQLGNVLDTFLIAGLILGIYGQEKGEKFGVESLFTGFRHPQTLQLLMLGIVSMLLYGTVNYFMLNEPLQEFQQNMESVTQNSAPSNEQISTMLGYQATFYKHIFFSMLANIPVMMLFWFAIPLVVIHNVNAYEAMKLSFLGCVKNLPVMVIFLVLGIIFGIFATIPLALGWFVFMPVLIGADYTGWKDIYTRQAAR